MVADDLIVEKHGEENLDMHLLMLAHLVKKLSIIRYQVNSLWLNSESASYFLQF